MPEGTMTTNIQGLQSALAGITGLLGQPGANGSGFAGAASLAETSPADRVQGLAGQLGPQMSGVFDFDAAASLEGATGLFGSLKTQMQASPTQAMGGFAERITEANTAIGGDFVQRLQQTLDAIRGISEGVPEDRTAIISALLDQILGVLGSMKGPEAERIQAWVEAVQEQYLVLMPLIEEARSAPDPSAVALQVVQHTMESTLEVFGFGQAKKLVDLLDGYPANRLPQVLLDDASTNIASVSAAYGQTLAADGDYAQFRDTAVAAYQAMEDLKDRLRPIMSVLRSTSEATILQPHALETFLREHMEAALAVEVNDVRKIDDPFKALFDRIDAAIEDIDLSFVRTEVLDFFETTRDTIEQVDIASVGDFLQEQLGPVENAVQDLQRGVTGLLAQLEAFFDNLTGSFRTLAGNVGTFGADGTFQFFAEQDLRRVLTSARLAIGGDPDDPGAPSVAGALGEVQTSIDGFLDQLNALLEPVEATIGDVRTTAVEGIEAFSDYLQGLDVPALIEQLRQKVEEIIDALIPIDFAVVVDPVVAEIEENTAKLREIDTESLNELLRAALAVALDVIIKIDFTAAISTPLEDEFAAVKAVPAQAIEQLQERYEQAISTLDDLNPEQLLQALFAAFDTLDEAVGTLDVTTLLRPLDELHEQHLQRPLDELKPSTLLQPVSEAFQDLTPVFDGIDGATIIAPVNDQLNTLKAAVEDLDITGWIDDLLAAVEEVKQDLRDIRPSEILQPLVEDFERLEAELDRFKPSVLFGPVAELAAPLLQFLEGLQQQTTTALFEMFQAPVRVLDRLQPETLTQSIQKEIDNLIVALRALQLPVRFNQLKGQYFDLQLAVQADDTRASLVAELLDPQEHLGEFVSAHDDLLAALEGLKQNVEIPDLAPLYDELRVRMLALLPPFARELLDPETFKRIMRLADPTRFLQELDGRFEALKNKLIPIRPQDIAAELDETYETVLALVDELEIEESLNQVKDMLDEIKGVVSTIRIDFVAADIDRAVDDLRAMVDALDVSRLFADLDALHHEVELVVESTLPSQMLSGLQETLDQVKDIVEAVDPRTVLGASLNEAWESVQGVLDEVDFTVILSPIVDKLDELEASFETNLRRTEDAFDTMLGAARGALGGGVSVGASL
jgi:methyl-accepting chemotaxis protein